MRFHFVRKKRPSEEVRLGIDFASDIASVSGDAPSSLQVSAVDVIGRDAVTLLQDELLVGSIGYVTFFGGSSGDYFVKFVLTTVQGFIYEHDIRVPVRNGG